MASLNILQKLWWKAQMGYNNQNCDPEVLEKFAELIVKECAKIADVADENKCEWIGGNILTHFGVEE